MFTGIVEGKRPVVALSTVDEGLDFVVELGALAEGCGLGDSIAINGCCLTVSALKDTAVTFHAGRETLGLTYLGELSVGDAVNVERSLSFGDPFGGHLVSGHVDGVGEITGIEPEPSQCIMRFRLPDTLRDQVMLKGSIALDGISLTITEHAGRDIAVALIPHTLHVTNLGDRKVGDRVNVECDMMGKWIQRQAQPLMDEMRALLKRAEDRLHE